jgi:hypothetical protein
LRKRSSNRRGVEYPRAYGSQTVDRQSANRRGRFRVLDAAKRHLGAATRDGAVDQVLCGAPDFGRSPPRAVCYALATVALATRSGSVARSPPPQPSRHIVVA